MRRLVAGRRIDSSLDLPAEGTTIDLEQGSKAARREV